MMMPKTIVRSLASHCKRCCSTASTSAAAPREEISHFSACRKSSQSKLAVLRPSLDFDFLLNPEHRDFIRQNIANRKGVGNIDRVHEIWNQLSAILACDAHRISLETTEDLSTLWDAFYEEACALPNHSSSCAPIGCEPLVVCYSKQNKPKFERGPFAAEDVLRKSRMLRLDMGRTCGEKSYAFLGILAELERALVRWSLDRLESDYDFREIKVKNFIQTATAEACGLVQRSDHRIIYALGGEATGYSLSGTAELSIAEQFWNATLERAQLPLRLCAVSRCYRPEVEHGATASGLYRLHEFTKVEMFVVSEPERAEAEFERLCEIQQHLYDELGLHYRVLEMPTAELGAPAYRKRDLESWMPSRNVYGEVCSASNCTDFQSRRLNLRLSDGRHPFTLNATACAVPRTIVALAEQHQTRVKTIALPECLRGYMTTEMDSGFGKTQSPDFSIQREKPHSDFSIP